MRRAAVALLVVSLHVTPRAAAVDGQQTAPVDAVAWFLDELEAALEAESEAPVDALVAPAPPGLASRFRREVRGAEDGTPVGVVLRERERRRSGTGFIVTADLLATRDRAGRLATYDLTLRPRSAESVALELTVAKRLNQLDGLFRLQLDTARPYEIRRLEFVAPDLAIRMASGFAFAASNDEGMTALVLRGRGHLRFTPPDPAEQNQLRVVTRRPTLDVNIEDVFIRLNPGDLRQHLAEGSLLPAGRPGADPEHARAVFDRFLPRSYSLMLGDLSQDRWTITPPPGNLAVEFRTSRHGWLTYARSSADPEDITLFDRERGKNINLYASSEKVARRGRFYDEDASAAYDITRYDIDARFDPPSAALTGRGRLQVRVLADVAQTLSFRLAEPLVVTSASSPELGRLLPVRVSGQTTLLVTLPAPVTAGRQFTMEIAYSGRLEPQDFGADVALPDVQGRPIEIPETLQQPEPRFLYSQRSYWYPQALNSDFAPARLRLTVPVEYQILATGAEVQSSITAEARPRRTVEFVADRPVRYLACQISRFQPIGGAAAAGVTIDVAGTARLVNAGRNVAARAAAMIDFYAGLFGGAPYPRLAVGLADGLLPAGHSPAYFAFIQQPLPATPYTWRQDPLAFDAYPEFLLAHEIAHQWWGQAVGFKNYHDQWLSEGLAQYSAAAFVAGERPDLERPLIARMRASAQSLAAQGPIYLGYRLGHIEGRGAAFRGVVYNKSAVVLHMLRRWIGDEAFRRGLQRFYREWQFRKAGTDDLRAAFEAEAGRPLGRFFDRWILGSALPRLRARTAVDDSGRAATVRIEQIGEVFDLPLTIVVQYIDGRTAEVALGLTEAVAEQRIPLTGRLRRITARDELTLAEWVD